MQVSILKNGQLWLEDNCENDYKQISIKPQENCQVVIKCELDILDIQGFWTPELRLPSNKITWVIDAKAVGQRAFPFLTFFNSARVNKGTFSLVGLLEDCQFEAKMNQEKCVYEVTITIASAGNDFDFVVDLRDVNWLKCLENWRNLTQKVYPKRNIPDTAWEPVYCTWYAVHAAMTQDWVEKTAEKAVDLGFKTLIIDDGWCFDELKRVSPKTITSWYERIGDWEVSKQKFPDFIEHVKRVKNLGMQYMLWVTPFLIGAKSNIYQDIKDSLPTKYHEGCYTFNTDCQKACKIMSDKLSRLMMDYPIDGLKIDFLDYIFPNIETPKGINTMKFIEELSGKIRDTKNDALIEYRQSYATMQMLPFATQFTAGDVPFDFMDNFHRLCQIRISVGDKVPVHADPMYWHPKESVENIARHMIASLVGVPMLSMELSTLSKDAKDVILTHLKLYKNYQKVFNLGTWQIRYTTTHAAYAAVDLEKQSIIIVNDAKYLEEALNSRCNQSVLILNLSDSELNYSVDCSYTPNGQITSNDKINIAGHGTINL